MFSREPEQRKKKEGNGFVAGAVFGVIIGGVAALLLAPKTGRETQEELKRQARKVGKHTDARMSEVENELEGRIDNLKVAARELRGEAYEESQRLITRAEILKNDLQDSASRLKDATSSTSKMVGSDAKRLVQEGQAVIDELERMTRRIIGSAREKAEHLDGNGNQRQE